MLESSKKLRDQAKRSKNLFYQDVLDGLDEIEREISERFARIPTTSTGEPRACAADAEAMLKVIAEEDWGFFDGVRERYMPLPLDADGVPWMPTESWFIDSIGEKRALVSMTLIVDKEPKLWILEGSNSMDDMEFEASKCHHVKPRTVEDVLREFANSGTPTGDGGVLFETALIEKYADKMRELLGGDAE